MPTISILLKQNDERVICSFSCVNRILPKMNIVGEGYMGVAQSFFTPENTKLLNDYVNKNKTIVGFESSESNIRQYGFLFDTKYEYYHGKNCLNYYGHYGDNDILVIGNRVKSDQNLLNLYNDLKNSKGNIDDRVVESLNKNKVIGFDVACEFFNLSSTSISYRKYDVKGNEIYYEYYTGGSLDPIDFLYQKIKNPHR
jgi:hypothetical protein